MLALAALWAGAVAAPAWSAGHAARVADAVAREAGRNQPVDALIVFDDRAQAATLQAAVGGTPARRRLSRAEYAHYLTTKRMLLRSLKDDTLLSLGDPDVQVLSDYEHLPVVHARIRSARALEALKRQRGVAAVDAVVTVQPALTQSLPLIRQPEAFAAGHDGAGSTVAVLDTGVDYARTAFGACASPGGSCKVAVAVDFASADGERDSGNYHGTNVAAAVLGVAPGARIAALDVFEGSSSASSAVIINAINWCIANQATYNITAINMSLGGQTQYGSPVAASDAWGSAITHAIEAGIVVVAASGNNANKSGISLPAAYQGVVSVGAVYDANLGPMNWSGCSDASTSAGAVTCFSNSASFLTMVAPGAMISAGGLTMGGTSQAAPHVAGAVAVLRADYPTDTVAQTIDRLKLGATITDPRNNVTVPGLDLMASLGTPPATYRLRVSKIGSGSGTVVGSAGGLDCGATCSADITNGDSVTLTALHGPDAMFTGWSGACEGSRSTCTVAMTAARAVTASFSARSAEDLLPGGALPAAWTQTSGTAASWTSDATQAYVGTHALKSGTVGDGQTAAIELSGRFAAGSVSFARRVSSQSGGDFLRFYIDGVLQGSWSGEVAWGMVAFPIGAGTHTLKWAYEKNASGTSGSDAAWIDSLHLPYAAADARAAKHDFDGDGRADILWRHGGDGRNYLWLMDGPIRQDGSALLPTVGDTNWRVAGTGDFYGEGRAGVLWRHAVSGRNFIWHMDGSRRLATTEIPAVADAAWQVVGTGDFDGDGRADILWRHATSGRNFVWRMDGSTRLASTELPAVADTQWRVAGVADFDGDGKSDILWRHGASGRNYLWQMDGASRSASTELVVVANLAWQVAGVGDLDADGKADIVWRNASTGQNTVWLMNGSTRASANALVNVTDLAWRVVGVADHDGDGRADILWRHTGNGRNALWLMDGAVRRGGFEMESVGDLRWFVASP